MMEIYVLELYRYLKNQRPQHTADCAHNDKSKKNRRSLSVRFRRFKNLIERFSPAFFYNEVDLTSFYRNYSTSNTLASSNPLSLIHISEPTRLGMISYAVF